MSANSFNCPNCGHSFEHGDAVSQPQPECSYPFPTLVHSAGLSGLQERVQSLDALILRLYLEKAHVLRKINTIRDKSSQLPAEILSHIFRFVRPPIDFHNHLPPASSKWVTECRDFQRDTHRREEDYHLNLASVSHRWRQITLSTPQLWTTISIGVWKASIESHISLLDLYSQYTGKFGISIELDFRFHMVRWQDDWNHETELPLLEPIFGAIFTRFAPKILHLTFIAPPLEILSNNSEELSLCSSLTIYGACREFLLERPPTVTLELPCLQNVFLCGVDFPFVLPWSSITVLELERIARSVSFDALMRCPNLVKFSNYGNLSRSQSFPDYDQSIVNKNLESMLCDDDIDFYRCFQFTNLHTLHWGNIYLQDWSIRTHRIQIFSTLPSTLVSLTLGQVELQLECDLQNLLVCVPQLLELRLFDCNEAAIDSAIRIIGRPSLPSHSPLSKVRGPIILPSLCELSISSHWLVRLDMVVDMLEALSSVRTSESRFQLEVSKISQHEAASRRLQALRFSGFNIKITTGVKMPDTRCRKFPWW